MRDESKDTANEVGEDEIRELLSKPEWVDAINRGKEEVARGVEGKSLDELAD